MKKSFITIAFFFCLAFVLQAKDLILSNTGNPQLDGVYKPSLVLNGATSFSKTIEGLTFKIARFQVSDGRTGSLFGWMISDSNNKEYFAVTDASLQIPSEGWDIARAGVGLNVNFELTFRDLAGLQTQAFTMANTNASSIKVYPNPTFGEVMVEANTDIERLSLLNASGQVLKTGQDNRLDLSKLPSGIYFLSIQINGQQSLKRIVKQ